MTKEFDQQLQVTYERIKRSSDFDNRWQHVREILPEEFEISRKANGHASLYCGKWIVENDGGTSFESLAVFTSVESAARIYGMGMFCRILKGYGLRLKTSVGMYRICTPL
jgi:hypothetical protein